MLNIIAKNTHTSLVKLKMKSRLQNFEEIYHILLKEAKITERTKISPPMLLLALESL